jgi:hypothetical protein
MSTPTYRILDAVQHVTVPATEVRVGDIASPLNNYWTIVTGTHVDPSLRQTNNLVIEGLDGGGAYVEHDQQVKIIPRELIDASVITAVLDQREKNLAREAAARAEQRAEERRYRQEQIRRLQAEEDAEGEE